MKREGISHSLSTSSRSHCLLTIWFSLSLFSSVLYLCLLQKNKASQTCCSPNRTGISSIPKIHSFTFCRVDVLAPLGSIFQKLLKNLPGLQLLVCSIGDSILRVSSSLLYSSNLFSFVLCLLGFLARGTCQFHCFIQIQNQLFLNFLGVLHANNPAFYLEQLITVILWCCYSCAVLPKFIS